MRAGIECDEFVTFPIRISRVATPARNKPSSSRRKQPKQERSKLLVEAVLQAAAQVLARKVRNVSPLPAWPRRRAANARSVVGLRLGRDRP